VVVNKTVLLSLEFGAADGEGFSVIVRHFTARMGGQHNHRGLGATI
jgi:hypothetical protein